MKKKLSGYVIKRELVAGCLHRAALAGVTAGWFCAGKLHGGISIIIAVLCGAVSLAIIVESVIRAARMTRTGSEDGTVRCGHQTGRCGHRPLQRTEEDGTDGIKIETVVIPEEFYAVPGRKPAQRGRRKLK